MTEQQSLFGLSTRIEEVRAANRVLRELDETVVWEDFRPLLNKLRSKTKGLGGRPPYDALLMFKILLLQELYNLSDAQAELQIRDRLSFMCFLGLSVSSKVPDEKTIWLFREHLREKGLVKRLFKKFHELLRCRGIKMESGMLVDACIVQVPKSRNTRNENELLKSGELPESFTQNPNKARQKDTDSKWTKKRGKSYFGMKNHIAADNDTKLIEDYEVTAANVHDSQVFTDFLEKNGNGREVYADSAYRSERIETELQKRNYKSQVHERGYRQHPLTKEQKALNKTKSSRRVRVEHIFGTQSQCSGGTIIRTIGIARARVKLGLRNLLFNMRRAGVLQRSHVKASA